MLIGSSFLIYVLYSFCLLFLTSETTIFSPFRRLYILQHVERAFVLKFSAIEIYNEAIRDLLSTDSLPLRVLDDPEVNVVSFFILTTEHTLVYVCVCLMFFSFL